MYQVTLEAARVNCGMTQKQVGDAIGVNPSTIANWESGKTLIDVVHFQRLCAIYKCPIEIIRLPNG